MNAMRRSYPPFSAPPFGAGADDPFWRLGRDATSTFYSAR